MQERGIDMLFVLGGNGTHAGANAIHNEVQHSLFQHHSYMYLSLLTCTRLWIWLLYLLLCSFYGFIVKVDNLFVCIRNNAEQFNDNLSLPHKFIVYWNTPILCFTQYFEFISCVCVCWNLSLFENMNPIGII